MLVFWNSNIDNRENVHEREKILLKRWGQVLDNARLREFNVIMAYLQYGTLLNDTQFITRFNAPARLIQVVLG